MKFNHLTKVKILSLISCIFVLFSCIISFNTDYYELLTEKEKKKLKSFADTPKQADTLAFVEVQSIDIKEIIAKKPYTLVILWATWCKSCVDKIPNYLAFEKEYKQKGLQVVLVCEDYQLKNINRIFSKNSYYNPAYILSSQHHGSKSSEKAVNFRKEICPTCPTTEDYSSYGQYYLFNQKNEILSFKTGSFLETDYIEYLQ